MSTCQVKFCPLHSPGCPRESGRAGRLRSGVTGRSPCLQAGSPPSGAVKGQVFPILSLGPGWASQGLQASNKPRGPVQDSGPRCPAPGEGTGVGGQGRAGIPHRSSSWVALSLASGSRCHVWPPGVSGWMPGTRGTGRRGAGTIVGELPVLCWGGRPWPGGASRQPPHKSRVAQKRVEWGCPGHSLRHPRVNNLGRTPHARLDEATAE